MAERNTIRQEDRGDTERKVDEPREKLLVFGQGPVITEPIDGVNYWSEDLVRAAVILEQKEPHARTIVVLGGKTAGPEDPSEAELIAQRMIAEGIGPESIVQENLSRDTVENVVNYLNLFDSGSGSDKQKLSVLSAPFHSIRVRTILQLFKVPIENLFQSTEVIRYAARTPEGELLPASDSTQWNQAELQIVEDKLDINDPVKFSSKEPEESAKRSVADRYLKDDLYTREVLEFPAKWLPYIAKLHNGERIKAILSQVKSLYPGETLAKLGVEIPENIDDSALDKIKMQLTAIPKYGGLSDAAIESWTKDTISTEDTIPRGWPKETSDRLEEVLKKARLDKMHVLA